MLDAALGQHPQIEGVGELCNLVNQGFGERLYCACGRRVPECAQWSEVWERWCREIGSDPNRYHRLQQALESPRRLPTGVLHVLLRTPTWRRWATWTTALLDAIRDVSGRPIIVDSSKLPGRALAMAAARADLCVVHLVRDPRGVAHSLGQPLRSDPRQGVQSDLPAWPAARTARRWLFLNLSAELVMQRIPPHRRLRLRYEDLAAAPATAFTAIGRLLELDLTELGRQVAAGALVSARHTVAGNRLRLAAPGPLVADTRWQQELAPEMRTTVERVAAPLLRRYGYLEPRR